MKKFLKLLLVTFVSVFFILGTYNIAQASSHPTWQEVKKIRKEIVALGAEPIKRKGLQGDSKLLRILEKQLKELRRQPINQKLTLQKNLQNQESAIQEQEKATRGEMEPHGHSGRAKINKKSDRQPRDQTGIPPTAAPAGLNRSRDPPLL